MRRSALLTVTRYRYGKEYKLTDEVNGIPNTHFIANVLECASEKLVKSVNIWRKYGQKSSNSPFSMDYSTTVYITLLF